MIAESTTMIGELEQSLGIPTYALFAHWTGEYSVDVDEEAGRYLAQLVVERMRRERSDEVALIVGARGGYPAFADTLLRTVRQLDIGLQVIVPFRIDGVASLVAAAADSVTLHPTGAIGAIDGGLCVVPRRPLDAALIEYCPADPLDIPAIEQGEESVLARLAYDRYIRAQQRAMATEMLSGRDGVDDAAIVRLLEDTLGDGLSVGRQQLQQLGVDARVAPEPLAEQLEELVDWGRDALHLFESPDERFQVSDELASEVEFEPATFVPTAAIIGSDSAWLRELDTGSPDPDAPRLQGRWRRWDPQGDDSGDRGE